MKVILLSDLARCPQLWHELIPIGELRGGDLKIEDEHALRLSTCAESIPVRNWGEEGFLIKQPPKPKPMPRDEWPLHIRLLVLVAKPEDKGIGDVIARVVGPIGGDAFKVWYEKAFGKSCGCSERQETLNQTYPFS